MEKAILAKIIKKKLAEIKDYRYPHPSENYAPEHAIWFQKQDDLRASVSLVNDKYRYTIININSGKKLEEGSEATLPLAKKKVLDYYEKH